MIDSAVPHAGGSPDTMSAQNEEAEAILKAEAARLSAGVRGSAPDLSAEWCSSELAVRLLLANLVHAPVEVFERARAEHWASHDGARRDDCEFCGYCEAAVYEAKTGRSLAADFLPPSSSGEAAR